MKVVCGNTLVLQTGGKRVAPSLPRPHGRTGALLRLFSDLLYVNRAAKHYFVMFPLLKRTAVDVVKRLVALDFNCSLFFL